MPTIQRICLSRLKFIGDIVLTTPVIRALREKFPDAYLAYLGDLKAVTLLEHNPHLNEIIPYDFSKPDITEQLKIAWKLRRRKFDVFIDLFSNPRSALLARASGAPMRIGKDVPGRGRLYTHTIGDAGSMISAIEYHFHYLQPLGIPVSTGKTEIVLTEEERREARIYLRHQGVAIDRPIVAIHPGATWPNKMWPKEHVAELIDLLRAKLKVEVLLSPGPGDDQLIGDILHRCSGEVHQLPVLPVRQLAGVLSQCTVFVSNDCGPMHIGVAVGTKTLGIFGPEPPEVWFPYNEADGHKALFRTIECSPCRVTACHRDADHQLECLRLISVTEVLEEVGERIRQTIQ
jgi:ADP-heptose:LPS heptosyltransferase